MALITPIKRSILDEKCKLIFAANCKNEFDAFFAALHVAMLEMNFIPKDFARNEIYSKFPVDYMKNGTYCLEYFHHHFPNVPCSICVIPMNPIALVHGFVPDSKTNRTISINVKKEIYAKNITVDHPIDDIYFSLPKLLLNLENNFIYYLVCDLYENAGIQPVFIFDSLSAELKFKILTYLPAKNLVAISMVNKEINELSNTQSLWKKCFMKDFSNSFLSNTDDQNWKSLYKAEYIRRAKLREFEQRARYRQARFPIPRVPWLYPRSRWEYDLFYRETYFSPDMPSAFPNLNNFLQRQFYPGFRYM